MKVTLALAIISTSLASVSLPEDTVVGKLRVDILNTDGVTVISSQDVDDSASASNTVEAVFNGVPAGTYIGRAQRMTGGDTPVAMGATFSQSFVVEDVSAAQPKTFGQPSGLSVTVAADDAA